jgi:cell wall-active antibiotic response 4TMS protein YvqF
VRINTSLIFWGVTFITAGLVALAFQTGTIDADAASDVWRFWPVVIIVIGIAVIAARTPFAVLATVVAAVVVGGMAGTLVAGIPNGFSFGCEGNAEQTIADDGSFGATAEVDLSLNCGELDVTTTTGSDWSVEADYAADPPTITAGDDTLRVESGDDFSFFGFADADQAWNVLLPTDPDLDLEVDANAASSTLDLDGATLSRLSIDANAGEVVVMLPAATVDGLSVSANAGSISIEVDEATELSGSVEMNAGSFELCVPDGVGLEITMSDDNVTFSHNLDERGLTREGDVWHLGSGDAVSLSIEGNAASFELNPEGGCK